MIAKLHNQISMKLRDRALLYICYYCGPTVKELQSLRAADIEANDDHLVISFPTRSCTISDLDAKIVILRWNQKLLHIKRDIAFFARIKKNNEPIDAPLSAVSINKIIQKQFPCSTLKTFREKLVCRLIRTGANDSRIKDLMGFKSVLALKKYKNLGNQPQV